jgi:hypothetical protein
VNNLQFGVLLSNLGKLSIPSAQLDDIPGRLEFLRMILKLCWNIVIVTVEEKLRLSQVSRWKCHKVCLDIQSAFLAALAF